MKFCSNIILQLKGDQSYQMLLTRAPNLLIKSTTSLNFYASLGQRGNLRVVFFSK